MCIYIYIYIYTHVWQHGILYTPMSVYMYVYVCIYIYICILCNADREREREKERERESETDVWALLQLCLGICVCSSSLLQRTTHQASSDSRVSLRSRSSEHVSDKLFSRRVLTWKATFVLSRPRRRPPPPPPPPPNFSMESRSLAMAQWCKGCLWKSAPFAGASPLQSSSRNCSLAPDWVLLKLIFQHVIFSGGVFFFTDTGKAGLGMQQTTRRAAQRERSGARHAG